MAIARALIAALAAAPLTVAAQAPLDVLHIDGFERLQAMRIESLQLRDPHFFAVVVFPCLDVTGSVDTLINDQLGADADADGYLDNSPMLLFRPLRTDGGVGMAASGNARCTAPAAGTSCAPPPEPAFVTLPYDGLPVGTCMAPVDGTVRPYSPAVADAVGPCFAGAPLDEGIDLGGIVLPLQDLRFAGTQRTNPTSGISNGLLRGFLSEAAADALILPASLPLIGGQPLSRSLPGGTGNCAAHSDLDVHEGESGWWFYFNYGASEVPYAE